MSRFSRSAYLLLRFSRTIIPGNAVAERSPAQRTRLSHQNVTGMLNATQGNGTHTMTFRFHASNAKIGSTMLRYVLRLYECDPGAVRTFF